MWMERDKMIKRTTKMTIVEKIGMNKHMRKTTKLITTSKKCGYAENEKKTRSSV